MTEARAPVRLPARIGALLATPLRAFVEIDRVGGGFRDAFLLVLIGIVCFRSDELARAFFALTHVGVRDVLGRVLGTVSREFQEAAMIVLPAAVATTVLAGRGRRDPSRDLELGAACFVPFFAVRALIRTLELPALLGPLSPAARQAGLGVGALWTAAVFVLALRTARRRSVAAQDAHVPLADASPMLPATGSLSPTAASLPPEPIAPRIAVTLLAGLLGLSFMLNAVWIARNAEAISPLSRKIAAPDFRLPHIDGAEGTLALSTLRGKTVLLDFWATWCPPCLQMLPTLHDLHAKFHARGVEFVGIHTPDVPANEVRAFLKERPIPYPVIQDDDNGSVAALFRVVGLPHFVLIDREGYVVREFWGYTTRSILDRAIDEAVNHK